MRIERLPLMLLLLSLIQFFHADSEAQIKQRVIKEMSSITTKSSPVRLVARSLDGKNYGAEDQMYGGSDWLRQLSLVIRNVSKKNITFIEMDLRVPKNQRMPNETFFSFFFGSRYSEDTVLRPGDKASLRIDHPEKIFGWLKEYDSADPSFLWLELRRVHFDDDTAIESGLNLKRDSYDRSKWRTIFDQDDFF